MTRPDEPARGGLYPAGVLDLPRSARLALWGAALSAGTAGVDVAAVLRAVQRDDEPHTIDGSDVGPAALADWLRGLPREVTWRLVLPAAGDPHDLTGPAATSVAATDAGEAVAVTGPGGVQVLVPEVTEFGSELEPGALVQWRVLPGSPLRPLAASLADADRVLRQALRTATETLASLEVSRWREDAAERIAAVRDGGLPRGALPPGAPARLATVLATAVRVRAVVSLALEDDGAAVSGWEADRRARALRDVDAVARRSTADAVNAALAGHAERSSTSR